MNRSEASFWDRLFTLTKTDTSVPVPSATYERAIAIFQTDTARKNQVFSLRPAFTGMVRKGDRARKLLYELGDEYIVQLEQTCEDTGMFLTGFVHGFDDAPVVLYGEECVFQASLDAGSFSFEAVPEGEYALSFSHGGKDYWVTGLQLRADQNTP